MDMVQLTLPSFLLEPIPEFADEFARLAEVGRNALAESRVVFTGLARNCEGPLGNNLHRVEEYGAACGEWRLHIETNDNVDGTVGVLEKFCGRWPLASFRNQTLNRQQFSAEFAGPRTVALAEYRAACQAWATAQRADIVVVMDFDAWCGCPLANFYAGVGQWYESPTMFGMAAVSLLQARVQDKLTWMHYDCWALRLNSYWDDYTSGVGGWKHHWLPAVGSPAVPVCSAFGGLAMYDPCEYAKGIYDGSDCEHVTFHRSIASGRMTMGLCPSLRMLMRWELDDAQHCVDSV